MLRIKLVKSVIGSVPRNRATVRALGLKKTGQVVDQPDNPAIRGMIHHVKHLLSVEEVAGHVAEKKAKPAKTPPPAMKEKKAPPAKKPAAKKAAPAKESKK